MPDARDQFFKLYNISDDFHRNAFFEAIVSWVQEMRNLAFPKDCKRHSVKLVSACDSAWCATGIRCQAMQFLAGTDAPESRIQAATLLDIVGAVLSFGPIQMGVITKHELMNKALPPEVAGIISFVWLDKPETRDARDTIWWTTYQNKQGYAVGLFSLRFPSVEPGYEVERDLAAALSPSQKRAAEELRVLIGAKRSQVEVCSVRPSFNSIVIGPSGSGKTHSVRAAAQSLRLALLELSLGSWMPCGSRTSMPTQLRLAHFVKANTGGVVFIDEADKLKPKHELASDWTRYLLSELLSLLDGRTDEWEGWTAELAAKFRSRYHVILGGAWQDAYTDAYRAHSALGGDWSNISIADTFLDDNWMPDEILFRVCGHVIEVFPPSLADIKAQVERIDAEMGFPYDSARVEKAARAIADERSGYRGIEKHVVSNLLRINLDGPPDSPTLKQDDIPF